VNVFIFKSSQDLTATPLELGMPYQEVWFEARDGVLLNGWFIPGHQDIPLILFFHGNGGNLSDNLPYLNLLHKQGFPIFIFDYRGYGKSAGQPLGEKDLYQDARGAVSYLERAGWRHERMIFFGQSLGAAVALQAALESPPAGVVMEAAFTCMTDIVKYTSPLGYYTVGWWGIDMPFDNLAKIAKIRAPLLLIHGENDKVVPVYMTRQLFQQAGEPKMLHIVRGGGHCELLELDCPDYLAAWSNYLQAVSTRVAAGEGVKP
jgi:pimeloyl-ACP methyl ester carboxylesterase